jgi:hypothetical protein
MADMADRVAKLNRILARRGRATVAVPAADAGPATALVRDLPTIPACPHRGGPTGETGECQSCRGTVRLKVFACAKHPEGCTLGRKVPGKHLCDGGA